MRRTLPRQNRLNNTLSTPISTRTLTSTIQIQTVLNASAKQQLFTPRNIVGNDIVNRYIKIKWVEVLVDPFLNLGGTGLANQAVTVQAALLDPATNVLIPLTRPVPVNITTRTRLMIMPPTATLANWYNTNDTLTKFLSLTYRTLGTLTYTVNYTVRTCVVVAEDSDILVVTPATS